jgi:hypothetical protein
MNPAFDDWWDAPIDMADNPYRQDSAVYWAWAGWKAGIKAEQDRCCKIVYGMAGSDNVAQRTVDAIRGNHDKG